MKCRPISPASLPRREFRNFRPRTLPLLTGAANGQASHTRFVGYPSEPRIFRQQSLPTRGINVWIAIVMRSLAAFGDSTRQDQSLIRRLIARSIVRLSGSGLAPTCSNFSKMSWFLAVEVIPAGISPFGKSSLNIFWIARHFAPRPLYKL